VLQSDGLFDLVRVVPDKIYIKHVSKSLQL